MNQEEEVNRENNIVVLIFPLESFCSAYLIIELCISIIYVLWETDRQVDKEYGRSHQVE